MELRSRLTRNATTAIPTIAIPARTIAKTSRAAMTETHAPRIPAMRNQELVPPLPYRDAVRTIPSAVTTGPATAPRFALIANASLAVP